MATLAETLRIMGITPELVNALDTAANQAADGTVGTTEIGDLAVTSAKLAANAVTTAKITDANVTTAKITDANVTTAKLATDAVTTVKVTDLNVTTAKLAARAVTAAKALVFQSTETTATGSSQNVAHGLGVVPAVVFITITESPGDLVTGGAFDIAEGSHSSTNVVVTITTGLKFKVLAWG